METTDVLLELYYNRLFVTHEGLYQGVRNLLFPHWGPDNRGVWTKGEYGTDPLGADHFCILDTRDTCDGRPGEFTSKSTSGTSIWLGSHHDSYCALRP